MKEKGYLALMFAISGIVFLSGFSVMPTNYYIIFTLLMALFAVPISSALIEPSVRSDYAAVSVIIASSVPLLLIIDPIEIGLWGYDPYTYSLPAFENFRSGGVSNMLREGSYPGTYSLATVIYFILGISTTSVAKYLPFIVVLCPFCIFLYCRRHIDTSTALITGILAASTRTLLTFESKFVDEILAVTMFFVLLIILPHTNRRPIRIAFVSTVIVLIYSHHSTGALLILFLVCWRTSGALFGYLSSLPVIGPTASNFIPIDNGYRPDNIDVTLTGILVLSLPILFASNFLRLVMMNIISAASGQTSELSGGTIHISSSNPFSVLSSMLVFSLVILTLFSITIIYFKQSEYWEVGWVVYTGILGVFYAITLIAGRIVPLDPIRLLVFIVPLLAAISVAQVDKLRIGYKRLTLVIICILIILPNLAAVPPNLLLTDIDEKPSLAEGHYTPQHWNAAEWSSIYSERIVYAHETGVWAATENRYTGQMINCGNLIVVSREPSSSTERDNKIYSNGFIGLNICSPTI